jgi:hypothetical protein
MSLDELKELVEAPLDDDVQCLDLDEDVKISVSDRRSWVCATKMA